MARVNCWTIGQGIRKAGVDNLADVRRFFGGTEPD